MLDLTIRRARPADAVAALVARDLRDEPDPTRIGFGVHPASANHFRRKSGGAAHAVLLARAKP